MVKSVVKVGPFGRILAKKWESAPPATDPFQDVPDEILTMIFRGLGGKELRSVARVCKRFARIAQFELCRAGKFSFSILFSLGFILPLSYYILLTGWDRMLIEI